MKYTIIFEQNGIKKRTVIEAQTEFYARRKLIDSCEDIMDFFKGYMR